MHFTTNRIMLKYPQERRVLRYRSNTYNDTNKTNELLIRKINTTLFLFWRFLCQNAPQTFLVFTTFQKGDFYIYFINKNNIHSTHDF